MKDTLDLLIKSLCKMALPEGGFSTRIGARFRPDATAWAVMALHAAGSREDLVVSGQRRLALSQMPDGRVSLSPICPQAFWPTSLAILALSGSRSFHEAVSRGITFLLATTGKHWQKNRLSVVGHDTMLRGWPWIGETHSWVEPTSMALLALEVNGHGQHERASEARHLLLDRQLSAGGWNYGNASVFGKQLWPMPESAGQALSALAESAKHGQVEKSLLYLKNLVKRLHTPLSLGWALLGLGAWGERPDNASEAVFQCFNRQEIFGFYDTEHLALLTLSLLGKGGFIHLFSKKQAS